MVDRKNNKMIDKSLSVAHHLYCLYQNDKIQLLKKLMILLKNMQN